MKLQKLLVLCLTMTLVACGNQTQSQPTPSTTPVPTETSAPTAENFKSEDIHYESRGVNVSATVTLPSEQKDSYPLVLICHGHGGSKDENVGLKEIAEQLSEKGIATIRMNFPGCGDSEEPFTNNYLTNMKEDVQNALAYMEKTYPINKDQVGIFGYSMGGRISLELLEQENNGFHAAAFLAPAADTEDLKLLFGGADNWENLKKEANTSENHYATFVTIFNQEQQLSPDFFKDLEAQDMDTILTNVKNHSDIPTLVVYATDDNCVNPKTVSQHVADVLGSEVVTVNEGGHGYGFYDEHDDIRHTVSSSVADFFYNHLIK